jgi:glutamate dehydrogenase (NAD(P)+)
LDVRAVAAHKDATGSVVGFADASALMPKEVLEVECEILVPAAIENQITLENAHRISTKLIVEAANGPTSPGADEILAENGILVLPDILAGAGGVIVSYYEWVQNLENHTWEEHDVRERLRRKINTAVDLMVTKHAGLAMNFDSYKAAWHAAAPDREIAKPDLRIAAQVVAMERIRLASEQRGLWP